MKWRPKISLLSMMLLPLLVGSALALCLHWQAWYHAFKIEGETPLSTAFSADSRYFARMRKGYIERVDATSGHIDFVLPVTFSNSVSMALSPDGSFIAAWWPLKHSEQQFLLMDARDRAAPIRLSTRIHRPGEALAPWAVFSADGRFLTVPTGIFETATGKQVCALNPRYYRDYPPNEEREPARRAQTLPEFCVAASQLSVHVTPDPTGCYLLTQLENESEQQLWDLSTFEKRAAPIIPHSDTSKLMFSGNGEFLIERLKRGYRYMNAQTGEEQFIFRFPDYLVPVGMSRNGSRVLCAQGTHGLTEDYYSLEQTRPDVRLDFASWRGAAILSPDGNYVAESSGRFFWNKEIPLEKRIDTIHLAGGTRDIPTHKLEYIEAGIVKCFSPDSQTLLTGSASWTHIWKRRRSEHWAGIFTLAEFWTASFFTIALLASLVRDWQLFRRLVRQAPSPDIRRAEPAAAIQQAPVS